MARTPSNMIPLGTEAFKFNLFDTVSSKYKTYEQLKGENGTVIMFICNHCPFVIHVNPELINLAKDYIKKGIAFVGISSNDVENFPQDGPELMKQQAKSLGYPFPYLYDQDQNVAKQYDAACTPDFYIYNNSDKLIYRGQLDDSRPGNNIILSGKDIRHALDCLLHKKENTENQKPSIGCNIKWKS